MRTLRRLRSLLLVVMIIPWALFAQPPDSLWIRYYGGIEREWGGKLLLTSDGGFVLVGNTRSYGAGDYNVWMVKADTNGDTLWTRTYGGSALDQCSSVLQASDGGYVIAGKTRSSGAGYADYYLVKMDSMGVMEWSRTYGGDHMDECYTVKRTLDGGYILGGATWSFGEGASDVWLVKTDADGDTLWTRTYGGVHDDYCVDVVQVADSGYVMAWMGDYSDQGVWMAKLDSTGNLFWSRIVTDPKGCWCFRQTLDGGFIFGGDSSTYGCEDYDFWLMKTDDHGIPFWSRTYRSEYPDICYDVIETMDGGFAMAGYCEYCGSGYRDFRMLKADADGDSMWSCTYGGSNSDECASVRQDADGCYLLAGTGWPGVGWSDLCVVKTDAECENWTPVAPEVIIEIESDNVRLWWSPVTESVAGCPIEIEVYNIYNSCFSLGPFELLAVVNGNDSSYVQQSVVLQHDISYYNVKAVTENHE